MPGFVDVSDMSAEEIRRLDHAADYDEETNKNTYLYRNKHAYRRPMPKKPLFSYDSDDVWGAAVIAYRVNDGYVKALGPGIKAHKTNRQIVEEYLQSGTPILEVDLEEGRKIRQYFKALTFKIIEGKTLTPFLNGAMQIAERDIVTDNLSIGTIASLPATYKKMTARDSVDNRMKWARGGFIGEIGNKVTEPIEIIKQLWSNNYNTWYYTGINDKDQVLFFAHKGTFKIGDCVTIEGKVKSHRENSTRLSHVKVIENV
jgi:hypothetical protein